MRATANNFASSFDDRGSNSPEKGHKEHPLLKSTLYDSLKQLLRVVILNDD